jgi:multiple sugar transport system permease protein
VTVAAAAAPSIHGRGPGARFTVLLFVLPASLFLLATMGYPIIYVAGTSLFDVNFAEADVAAPFVGAGNYLTLLGDGRFWNSIVVTALFTFFAVSIELLLGLVIALLLARVVRGRRPIVALLLIPTMMMPVAVGLMWRFMLDDGYGMVAYQLKQLSILGPGGLIADPLLVRPLTALASVIAADVWEWTPFMALILFAGLQSLPVEPFEAALVDGASRWQEFRFLTLPLLRRAVAVAVLIRIADAMRVLDVPYALTGGGPGNSTETIQLYVYKLGFGAFETGQASAMVVVTVAITIVVSAIIYRSIVRQQETGA